MCGSSSARSPQQVYGHMHRKRKQHTSSINHNRLNEVTLNLAFCELPNRSAQCRLLLFLQPRQASLMHSLVAPLRLQGCLRILTI